MHIIKQIPEDFIVKEKISLNLMDRGAYSCFLLKKRNLSTHEAVEIVADRLNVQLKNISYCGNKDRKAVAEQYISILKCRKNFSQDFSNITLEFIGFLKEPISLGDNEGNDFEIIVRNIDDALISGKIGIQAPNYFDEQRFSDDNFEVGMAIIKKDFGKAVELILKNDKNKKAGEKIRNILENQKNNFVEALKSVPKKQRMIYIHSVQSYIFNELAAKLILMKSEKFKKVKYSLGEFVFPEEKFENRKLPVAGFDELEIDAVDAGIESDLTALLDKIGLQRNNFIIRQIPDLSAESGWRKMFVDAQIEISSGEDEINVGKKKCLLKFFLPKGSYATIIVKKMFS
ncbi:MAG TPA: tRNA pseudouridine(13) synthase TruD [Candidatus Nanoarchaeia archaeon]|nr:tRNA pseudouridine(13) synthase TruD [Candidatus Nanoarchaeia archaeon]